MIFIMVIAVFLGGACFSINLTFLNTHSSYRHVETGSVNGINYDYYLDTDGVWVSLSDKDNKEIWTDCQSQAKSATRGCGQNLDLILCHIGSRFLSVLPFKSIEMTNFSSFVMINHQLSSDKYWLN